MCLGVDTSYILGMSRRFANFYRCAITLKMGWVNGNSFMILPVVSDRFRTFQFHCFRIVFLFILTL